MSCFASTHTFIIRVSESMRDAINARQYGEFNKCNKIWGYQIHLKDVWHIFKIWKTWKHLKWKTLLRPRQKKLFVGPSSETGAMADLYVHWKPVGAVRWTWTDVHHYPSTSRSWPQLEDVDWISCPCWDGMWLPCQQHWHFLDLINHYQLKRLSFLFCAWVGIILIVRV